MKIIAPSILSADFSRLGDEVRAVETAGADWIHIDVMDGHFVPNITVGPFIVEAVRKVTSLPLDVHLMIENASRYVADFVKAGAHTISVHAETGFHLDRVLHQIRELGAKPAVALNPATPISQIENVLGLVDMVLVMTVNPGFGGQKFIPYCKAKIKALRGMIDQAGLKTLIEVDGGVTIDNIGELSRLGADLFVAGSAIFGSPDYGKTIAEMKKKIHAA